MRLRRFTVDGFAQLDHIDIEFRDEAPNIIFGLNETGKSHLMQAFHGMFFGIEHPHELLPWSGRQTMRGVLDFIDGQSRLVRLERDLTGNDVRVSIADESPWEGKVKGSTVDARRFAECLQAWFGFRDRSLFTSTTFVRQDDVTLRESHSLAVQIKELITGTDGTSYEDVLAQLGKHLDGLRRAPGKRNDREIESRKVELEALRHTYEEASAAQLRSSALQEEWEQINRQTEAARAECAAARQQIAGAQALIRAERDAGDLDEKFRDLDSRRRRLKEVRETLTVAEEKRRTLAAFAGTSEAALLTVQRDVMEAKKQVNRLRPQATAVNSDELNHLERAVSQAEEELNALPLSARSTATPHPERRTHMLPAGVLALAGFLLALFVHPIALVLVAVAAIYVALPYFSGKNGDGSMPAEDDPRREQCKQRLTEAERSLRESLRQAGVATMAGALELQRQFDSAVSALKVTTSTRENTLRELGVATIDEACERLRLFQSAEREVRDATLQLAVLGDENTLEADWRQTGGAQAAKSFEVQELLKQHPQFAAMGSPVARSSFCAQLEQRTTDLDGEIETLINQENEVRTQIADLGRAGLQDAPALRNQMQELEPEVARLERQANALEIAVSELEGAVGAFRDHCLGDVMTDTSEFLRTITDGRYRAVHLESDDLTPTVSLPGHNDLRIDQLSRGVQDQLYFALRAALARSITRGRTLPLVLDDPFVNFDLIRREQVLLLLRGLIDRTQVILFTCDPWYTQHISPVLELPACATVGERAEQAGVA